jgi:hypothetical protein
MTTFRQQLNTSRHYEIDLQLPNGDAHAPNVNPEWAILQNLGVEGGPLSYPLCDLAVHTGGLAATIAAKARGRVVVGVTVRLGECVTRTDRFEVLITEPPAVSVFDVKSTFTQLRVGAGASH